MLHMLSLRDAGCEHPDHFLAAPTHLVRHIQYNHSARCTASDAKSASHPGMQQCYPQCYRIYVAALIAIT